MKRKAQQAAFVFAAGLRVAVFDVKKNLRAAAVGTFFDDENFPRLIDDEKSSRMVRRLGQPDRTFILKFGKNRFKRDLGERLGGTEGGGKQERGGNKDFFHEVVDVGQRSMVSSEILTAFHPKMEMKTAPRTPRFRPPGFLLDCRHETLKALVHQIQNARSV